MGCAKAHSNPFAGRSARGVASVALLSCGLQQREITWVPRWRGPCST